MTRTTSSLEAYNGVLGKIIQAKGGFYKFVSSIREEEFSKARDLKMLIDSGGFSTSQNGTRKKQRDRYAKILEACNMYIRKKNCFVRISESINLFQEQYCLQYAQFRRQNRRYC